MSIVNKQNIPSQIEMLAAQRNLYSTAKIIMGSQMVFGGPVAVCATLLGITYPVTKGYVALWGLLVLFFDLVILTPWLKKLRENGAKVQELFDCIVLDLPWNEIKVGKKPEAELIHEQATKFGHDAQKRSSLINWYPQCVQAVPAQLGSIICQRANVWWDSKLRRRYATTIFGILVVTTLSIIAYGICLNKNLFEFIAYVVAPMAAAYVVGYRQITEHRDAAERLDKLKDHAEKLWSEALSGASIETLPMKIRLLQDEIFDGRKRNPPIFDFIFKWFRDENETLMNKGAEVLVKEVENNKHIQPAPRPAQ